MRAAKTMGIALFAILAFTALGAAAASAHTWEDNKSPLTIQKADEGEATVEIQWLGARGMCKMRQKGKLGAGAAGLIESITNTSGGKTITCENISETGGECTTKSTITLEANGLPWKTELTTIGGELRDVQFGVKGYEKQWTIRCTESGTEEGKTYCGAAEGAGTNTLIRNAVGGIVESVFDKNSPNYLCYAGELRFRGTEKLKFSREEGNLSAS
jgi:hypothetical protein